MTVGQFGGSVRGTVSFAIALRLVEAAEAKAREMGVLVTVAVIDESGVLKAFHRMDGTPFASVYLSQAKAYAANTFQRATKEIEESLRGDPVQAAGFSAVPGASILPGGVPIVQGGIVVGAIGVGGCDQDAEIAQAAVAALG